MSPWDRMQEKTRQELEELQARIEKAKLGMSFAELQVGQRTWRLIVFDGVGFRGNERFPTPKFKYATCNLNWEGLIRCWESLAKKEGIPEEFAL